MATSASATISNPAGFEDLLASMTEVASESTLRRATVAGARVIMEEVKIRAPIGLQSHKRSGTVYPPGTLKKNIIIFHDEENSSVPGRIQAYSVVIGRDAFYGRIVEDGYQAEYGNSHAAAHPFFRPSVDSKTQQALQAIVDVLAADLTEIQNG
nr:HK97 gp10 family phage protein [Burkholderia gladioli]